MLPGKFNKPACDYFPFMLGKIGKAVRIRRSRLGYCLVKIIVRGNDVMGRLTKGWVVLLAFILLAGCGTTAADGSASRTVPESHVQPANSTRVSSSASLPAGHPAQADTKQEVAGVSAKVVKVIDGDTFQAIYQKKVTTVRVLLIDTPETHHPRLGVQPYGKEASASARELLEGKTVRLEAAENEERDKYGRLLAYVFVGDRSFAAEQLKRGLARVAYIYPPNTKYLDRYRAAENEAKQARRNIWSVPGYVGDDGFHPEVIKGSGGSAAGSRRGTSSSSESSVAGSFAPDGSGNCSGSIKGNISDRGKIYHLPSDRYYKATKAEICFKTRAAARKAGFRAAK
ncbi:MAG: thermonuclease family protein [Sporolactobacillus sp.]|nr:thermonuclease family protein [Sporolactobacillus sp.]